MGKNNVKAKQSATRVTKKTRFGKVVAISCVCIAVLLGLIVTGLVLVINNSRAFDYMTSDLSKYITLSDEDYKTIKLGAKFDSVTDSDVQRKINALLVKNKGKVLYDGAGVNNLPITLGDKVQIYYRGYTVDEEGYEIDLENASNYFDSDGAYTLEIGSGSFIDGFEEGLVGKIPADYSRAPYRITSGKVEKNDIIYFTYDAIYPDGTTKTQQTDRIDFGAETIDHRYGTGFMTFILGGVSITGKDYTAKNIGEKISENAVFDLIGGKGSIAYTNMKINYVIRDRGNPLVLDARFPSTYHEESLRGLEVKFEVYVGAATHYDMPEYNEEFITGTLKLTSDDLAAYPGETIVEKHMAMLREEAEKELSERIDSIYEDKIWDVLHEKVKVKKFPESEVNRYYLSEYNTIQNQYSIQTQYSSFDQFARAYLGLSSTANWQEYITKNAEYTVTEKLVFHYIMRNEGLIPEGDEFDTEYDRQVKKYLDYFYEYYKSEIDKQPTEELREAKKAEIKEMLLEQYGEQFFTDNVYYQYTINYLIETTRGNDK